LDQHDILNYIENRVIDNIVNILEMDIKDINIEKQFSEYGVDSISGVQLIKKINETFGITLKTTDLFDYANVKDLSAFINREHGKTIAEALGKNNTDSHFNAQSMEPSSTEEDEAIINLLYQLSNSELNVDETDKHIENIGKAYGEKLSQ
jgi:acyl carrier protein